jgi:hypothetical protein
MQKLLVCGAFAAVLAGGSAWAAAPGDFKGAARLADPVSQTTVAVVSGVPWRCAGDACVGLARRYNTLDSVQRECRRFVAAVGPVSAYASRGERLGPNALVDCNAAATNP